jgi:hypothetical protein
MRPSNERAQSYLLMMLQNRLNSSLNLAGTHTGCTYVDTLRCTVLENLNAFYIRFPCAVGVAHRVRNVAAEGYTLAANTALSHFYKPPYRVDYLC